MQTYKRLTILTLFLFTSLALFASENYDEIRFLQLRLEDKSSPTTIFGIDQDSSNNLWIITNDGLMRYNGYDFHKFHNIYNDSTSLLESRVQSLIVDSKDRVWTVTSRGLSLYRRTENNFKNYTYKVDDQAVEMYCVEEIDENRLCVGTEHGILFFDIEKGVFLDNLNQRLPKSIVHNLYYNNQTLYIGCEKGLYVYLPKEELVSQIDLLPQGTEPIVKQILVQNSEKLWIATHGNGLFSYNLADRSIKNYRVASDASKGLLSDYIHSLSLDKNNHLWIGTLNGLNIIRSDSDYIYAYVNNPMYDNSLSQNSVRSLFSDSQGGMWVGTYIGGLNYYHPIKHQFRHLKHIPYHNSISDNVISCIVEDYKKNLWIGTNDGGLNYYDTKSGKFTQYPLYNYSTNSQTLYNNIKTVYTPYGSQFVYVGMHTGGFSILNTKTRKTRHFNTSNSDIINNNVYAILPAEDNNLWLGTFEGLVKFNISNFSFKSFLTDTDSKTKSIIYVLYRDSKKRLWVGGENGVERYIEAQGELHKDPTWSSSYKVNNQIINAIYQSEDGLFFFGTRSGLYIVDEHRATEEVYTTENGFPSNIINGMLEDMFGRIWFSSNNGLGRFDQLSKTVKVYSDISGIQANQFNNYAYCKTDDGKFYFGGINGITYFAPEDIKNNPYAPSGEICELKVFNKTINPNDNSGILKNTIAKSKEIELKSDQNSFSLSFNVCNLISRTHNTFSYTLEGFDKGWNTTSQSRVASYTNVPAGDYIFRLKCANNDNIWSNDVAVLHIKVLPIWYKTWVALISFVVLLLSVIYIFIHLYFARKKMKMSLLLERREKEQQVELNQMKIQFYINMAHELRTPLTLILAPLQELMDKISDKWEREQLSYIQKSAKRLNHIVNQLMDYRRAEVGIFNLCVQQSNLYEKVLQNFLYYDKFAHKKEIDYNFYSDIQDEIVYFDENYIDLIINNLLSNSFKFTSEGDRIYIKLTRNGDNIVLEVTDTGRGIPKDQQSKIFQRFFQLSDDHLGSGVGVSLVHRLVDLHHGTITLESEEGQGTSFFISIPQGDDAYSPDELSTKEQSENHYTINSREMHLENIENFEEQLHSNTVTEESDNRSTILIADDNAEIRHFVASGLKNTYNVVEVTNGQEALDVVKKRQIDLMLVDSMMPVMSGIELCKRIKQNAKTYHIPIYIISAKSEQADHIEGLEAGADDYISKPFSMVRLVNKIRNTLRTRHRAFENYSNSIKINSKKITSNAQEEEWLNRALEVVTQNMDNIEFSTEQFASEMNMSRSNLHLKLKAITSQSAIDFIHKVRFSKACELLQEGKYSVSEISYMVGYNTPSYFTSRFKKYMKCLPSEYVQKE